MWSKIRGKDLRILIGSGSTARAKAMGYELDRHIKKGALFRRCYGDLFGTGEVWNNSEKVSALRKTNKKEASLTLASKSENLVSAHYEVLLLSDCVTDTDRDSAAARDETRRFVGDAVSLLEPGGLLQLEGTFWHLGDEYNHLIHEVSPLLEASGEEGYNSEVESCWNDDGTPRFEKIGMDQAYLDARRAEIGSVMFAANYENKPIPADSQIFTEEGLDYYDEVPGNLRYFGFVDPALGKNKRSDFSCIVILGKAPNGDIYLADVYMKQCPVSQLRKAIVAKFTQYDFEKFGGENNTFQSLILDETEKDLKESGHPFRITRVQHSTEKLSRIQAAESKLLAVKYPRRWREQCSEAMGQLFGLGHSRNDDFPDALESCLSLIGSGWTREQIMRTVTANRQATKRGLASSVVREDF